METENGMTVNDFIKILQNLKPSLRNDRIFIRCENGLKTEPNVKILQDFFGNQLGTIITE